MASIEPRLEARLYDEDSKRGAAEILRYIADPQVSQDYKTAAIAGFCLKHFGGTNNMIVSTLKWLQELEQIPVIPDVASVQDEDDDDFITRLEARQE